MCAYAWEEELSSNEQRNALCCDGFPLSIAGALQEYGPKVAVKELSLQLREGQLTSLLGHNGAGKKLFNLFCFNDEPHKPIFVAAISMSRRVFHSITPRLQMANLSSMCLAHDHSPAQMHIMILSRFSADQSWCFQGSTSCAVTSTTCCSRRQPQPRLGPYLFEQTADCNFFFEETHF